MRAVRTARVFRGLVLSSLGTLALVLTAPAATASARDGGPGLAVTAVRGGDTVWAADGARCTVGFNASGDGGFYGLLPGRCGGPGTEWFADAARQVPVGETSAAPSPGWSVIHYTNASLDYPSEVTTGAGTQRIERAAQPYVGMEVCGAGPATGVHCGTVEALDVTVSFPEGTVSGLLRTNLCTEPGGTAGPAVAGDEAVGIPVAGGGDCAAGGSSFYQPVDEPLSALGLEIGYSGTARPAYGALRPLVAPCRHAEHAGGSRARGPGRSAVRGRGAAVRAVRAVCDPEEHGMTLSIGIIGAGNIGSTLTRRLTALGHDVAVANSRDPGTLAGLASETGARAVRAEEAPHGADLVVVTIPEIRVPDLPSGLFEGAPEELVVVDTGNYYPQQRDGPVPEIEAGLPESRWVERQLHHPVIKAFNNIYAPHLVDAARPEGTPGRTALPVAGDDERAKGVVMGLVNDLGFDPVDAGGLDESWRQQPGTPVYTTDMDADGVHSALLRADAARLPEWSATPASPGSFTSPA